VDSNTDDRIELAIDFEKNFILNLLIYLINFIIKLNVQYFLLHLQKN